MIFHGKVCDPKKVLVWQPSKRRFYCPACHRNFELLEVAFIKGGKE